MQVERISDVYACSRVVNQEELFNLTESGFTKEALEEQLQKSVLDEFIKEGLFKVGNTYVLTSKEFDEEPKDNTGKSLGKIKRVVYNVCEVEMQNGKS